MKDVLYIIIPAIGNLFWMWVGYKLGKHQNPVKETIRLDWEWNDINKIEVPSHKYDEEGVQILLTDGKIVRATHTYNVSFNRKGKAIVGYLETEATHWQYMPSPPKKDES